MPPRLAKLAGLGAFGAIAFFVALFAFVFWISAHRALGGIDTILSVVTWISLGVVLIALVVTHVVIGRGLLALSRGIPTEL